MPNPLSNATDWLYHLGAVNADRATQIGASDADLVVIEQSDLTGETARYYQPADLDVMRGGDDKMIVSYLSIGEAETYRDYWQDDWQTTAPAWLDEVNPNWDGNIKVEFWDPDWKAIVFDMVDQAVDQGFNGVYLDIIDAFYHFEETASDAGIDYRAEMVQFVGEIRERALTRIAETDPNRPFAIIGQNGAELVDVAGYLDAVDGIGQEDLQFIYDDPDVEADFQKQPDGDFTYTLDFLRQAEAAGTEVFVVEYMTQARQTEFADDLAAELEILNDLGIPLYLGEDRDLTEIYDQSAIANDTVVPDDTTTTGDIDSFAVQYSNADAAEIATTDYDLLIVEAKPGQAGQADLSDADVAALTEQGRIVAGYVSVGQTDDARPYWNTAWTVDGTDTGARTDAAPDWMGEQADSFAAAIVEFWNPDWQTLVIDQVTEMANRGYNGIFLDNVLSYYEVASLRGELGTEQAQFYATEMMAFVGEIAAAGQAIDPNFKVIGNGGPYIVSDAGLAQDSPEALAYYDSMDAIMAESFFGLVNGVREDGALDTFQNTFAAQGIDVLALEYSTDDAQSEAFAIEAEARGFIATVSADQGLSSLPTMIDTTPDPVVGENFIGTSGSDDLFGGTGDDLLTGKAGQDSLASGAGNDELRGNGGMDELFGEDGNDGLFGGGGHDYIEGGAGNDAITGGRGHDEMAGGGGSDIFLFDGNFGHDIIADFNVVEDQIMLVGAPDWTATQNSDGVNLEFANGNSIEFVNVFDVDDIMFA